jgi:hypothetical protein
VVDDWIVILFIVVAEKRVVDELLCRDVESKIFRIILSSSYILNIRAPILTLSSRS